MRFLRSRVYGIFSFSSISQNAQLGKGKKSRKRTDSTGRKREGGAKYPLLEPISLSRLSQQGGTAPASGYIDKSSEIKARRLYGFIRLDNYLCRLRLHSPTPGRQRSVTGGFRLTAHNPA